MTSEECPCPCHRDSDHCAICANDYADLCELESATARDDYLYHIGRGDR